MWYLNIVVFPNQTEERLLTWTQNTYWLQELVAKLLECENVSLIRIVRGEVTNEQANKAD